LVYSWRVKRYRLKPRRVTKRKAKDLRFTLEFKKIVKVVKSVKVIKKKQNKWMELINNLLKNDW